MKNIKQHEGKKYLRKILPADGIGNPIYIDVYSVIEAFGVTCPGRQQAIKKLLCAGLRGKGDELADLIGADAALSRAIELQRARVNQEKQESNEEHLKDAQRILTETIGPVVVVEQS
jgi:hypothetical protein